MKKLSYRQYLLPLFSFILLYSCETTEPTVVIPSAPEQEQTDPAEPEVETVGPVQFFNKSKMDNNYVLVNDAKANSVYLMDKDGAILYDFPLNGERLGNDVFLLDNGQLLAMLESADPKIEIGGFGGKLQILNADGTIAWNFDYSSDDHILHHDAEMLPNGNILTMIWERKTPEESTEAGYSLNVETFPDGLIEIDPVTNTIIWEWHVWDHVIQEHDSTKSNFGTVADNPQLIDINYVTDENGDITHGNAISYDPIKDVIYLSANFYSEVWVIDHNTTSEEASLSTGGQYGKGGDLIYRFGNPSAYKNTQGERLFHNNHYPNLLDGVDEGKMLIFSNGAELEKSTVYELNLPNTFELLPNVNNEPEVLWEFSNDELYSPKVSGAVKLPNGNILITEGDFGIWEVTKEKEIVWKYSQDGFFWRAYHYDKNAPEIKSLGL